MMRAFIDDTGNDPKQVIFNFAGWVGKCEEWNKFSNAWAHELQRPPAIAYFRHSQAKSRAGEFSGWSPADCDGKIFSLARVITKHDVYGVITGINHQVLADILKRAVPSVKTVRSIVHANRPYDFCFHSVVSMVLQYQVNLGMNHKVDFIFDCGDAAFNDWRKDV